MPCVPLGCGEGAVSAGCWESTAASPSTAGVLLPASLWLGHLLKAEATASVRVVQEWMLVFVEVPGEALSLQGFSQHLLSKQEKSLEPGAVVLCLLPCFLLWVQAGSLLLTFGTGPNVCQADSDFNKMFLGRIFCVLGCFLFVCLFSFRFFVVFVLFGGGFLLFCCGCGSFFFSFACIKIGFSHLYEKTEHLEMLEESPPPCCSQLLSPHLPLLCPPLIQSWQHSCFHFCSHLKAAAASVAA